MLNQSSEALGADAATPQEVPAQAAAQFQPDAGLSRTDKTPPTLNPPARELPFRAIQEADDVLARLNAYNQPAPEALKIDLAAALAQGTRHSRDYKFAEEDYVLAGLRLLIERHRWGPRFFDEVSAVAEGRGRDSFFDTSLDLVNELGVTQRLPYGGEVSARALARATEDLHSRVAFEETQDAEIILEANIPLLRGAGLVAQEDRIQAERDLVYAAREFEQFRRDFLFDVAEEFLDLVVQQQSVINAERQVKSLQEVEDREQSLYEAGRRPLFEAALAQQRTVEALDTLNSRREDFRLAVDRFKVQLGIPVDQAVEIVPSTIALAIPDANLDDAVSAAMAYRLDLQTQRDVVADARRGVDNARNDLLPDLEIFGSYSLPTDEDRARAGARFDPGASSFTAGARLGLPLDREIERLSVRQEQIRLERELRDYDELRDTIAVSVRGAVRDIDRARYSLEIQERSIAIGEQRKASIEAAPDRATARDASEAANELLQAQDQRDSARRDLQVAILRYLLETGQLRVNPEGEIIPLPGMLP